MIRKHALVRVSLWFLLSQVLAIRCLTSSDVAGNITLHYVPFGLQTYTAVTIDNIEHRALCVFGISSASEEALAIKRAISRAKEDQFNGRLVRLKIGASSSSDVFVDSLGGVLQEGEKQTRMPFEVFAGLKRIMDRLTRTQVQGCKIDLSRRQAQETRDPLVGGGFAMATQRDRSPPQELTERASP